MIEVNDREAYTTEPQTKKIYRAIEEEKPMEERAYFVRCTLLEGETADSFKEILASDIPQPEEPMFNPENQEP